MGRNRNRSGRQTEAIENAPTATATTATQNGLADAIGIGGGINPYGFPGNQGFPGSEQISQPTTIFKNLRWFLVSNLRQALSEAYVELGLLQTVVDVPVDDGLRGGVEIKSQQLSEDQLLELTSSLDRDDDLNTAGQAAKWNRLFGGAGILILTDQDPEEPLELDSITEDTPLEFRAVDMWELFWDAQNTDGYDPTVQEETFETYNYYGEQIHKSRVMRLKGITAPSFIRPRLRGWGFSVCEVLVRSINQYLKSTDLVFEVLDEFKVDVYKIKNLVNSLMSPQGETQIKRRVQLANYQKNYQNAVVMDSEDDWDHKQLSFTGIAEAMKEIRMQVASDLRMPLTKLFGISAAGFNSGEDDIEVYNAMVESQIRGKIKYPILRMIEVKCQKLFGFVPDDLSISFKPLRVLSAEQEENVKTQKFNRLLQAKQAGEIDSKNFRDACNKENLLGVTLDPDVALTEEDDLSIKPEGDSEDGSVDDGADPDSEKPTAGSKGGAPKGLEKSTAEKPPKSSADKPKTAKPTMDKPRKQNAWEESKHPRADDGKFGDGGSDEKAAAIKKKYPALSGGTTYHSEGTQDEVTETAKSLRKDGVHATIWHMEGPKTGAKSKYYVLVPESKKNMIICVLPKPFTVVERAQRLLNSATFDRKSYEADGGDAWIHEKRELFFSDEKAKDKDIWRRSKEASVSALGEERWQFVVWMYKKLGGRF